MTNAPWKDVGPPAGFVEVDGSSTPVPLVAQQTRPAAAVVPQQSSIVVWQAKPVVVLPVGNVKVLFELGGVDSWLELP
jgi:hypothetical protein